MLSTIFWKFGLAPFSNNDKLKNEKYVNKKQFHISSYKKMSTARTTDTINVRNLRLIGDEGKNNVDFNKNILHNLNRSSNNIYLLLRYY